MLRLLALLSLLALLLWSCGPDKLRTCSGEDPAFKVVLKLAARPLPADMVVHVTYGGSGKEDFRLSDPNARLEVTFCKLVDETGAALDASVSQMPGAAGANASDGAAAAAGTAGAFGDLDQPRAAAALHCDLWTAGFTELSVSGSGFLTVDYDLTPKKDQCTVEKELVLDSPDAG